MVIQKIIPGANPEAKKAKQIEKIKDSTPDQLSGDGERHQRFFDRIAVWNLRGEIKSDVAQTIIDDLNTGIEYRSQMLLAVVIATLWLLTNSTPVVIGAMLIAPIMRPIQGMAFATCTGNHSLFMRSLGLVITSIVWWVAVGALLTLVIPFGHPTAEILARTQPTLLDLFIALGSGAVAFLAFGYRKIASGIAGVAMAASLVPPLAVVGIGLAFGNFSIARGSLLLFSTNLIAIIIIGAIIFMLFGFSPNAKQSYHKALRNIGSIFLLLILLCVPLLQSFVNINQDIKTKNIINKSSKHYLQTIDSRINIRSMHYQSSPNKEKGKEITINVEVPQSIPLTEAQKLELTTLLAKELDESVTLSMNLIPVISVQKPPEKKLSQKEIISQKVQEYITNKKSNISVISTEFIASSKAYILTLYAPLDTALSTEEQSIKKHIASVVPDLKEVIIDRRQQKVTPTKKEQTENDILVAELRQSLSVTSGSLITPSALTVEEESASTTGWVSLTTRVITLDVTSFATPEQTATILNQRKTSIQKSKNRPRVQIDGTIIYKQKIVDLEKKNQQKTNEDEWE